MAVILSLETATTNCSVSISREGKLLALKEENKAGYSHSEKLHLFIEEALEMASLQLQDVEAVAVSKGPGSYTGLRIGVASAKGLCYALGLPLLGLLTLESLARQARPEEGVIIPLLDARRMEVYSAVYGPDYQELRNTKAEIIDENSFMGYAREGKVLLLGSGAAKCKSILTHPNFSMDELKLPSAREMCSLAFLKFTLAQFEDPAYFEPLYLKDFLPKF